MAPACKGLTVGDDEPVAIQVLNAPRDSDTLAVGLDTLVIQVRVLNRSGDSIPGAPVVIISLSPDTLGVDSARLAIFGLLPGKGRFIAKSGDLPSPPLPVNLK